jgi:hypothetical protein
MVQLGRGTFAIATCVIYLALTSSAVAQEGWSLKKLNPFQKDDSNKKRVSATVSDSGSFMKLLKIKAPSLKMPFSKPKPKAKKGPNGFQKFNAGTKKAFAKTTAVLQPWKKNAPAPPRTTKPPEKKSSPFGWLLPSPKEPKKEVRTPNEFLALPRP